MKRQEFIRLLERAGCVMLRHGGKHDLFFNPAANLKQPVPRHTEIHNKLATHIWKYLGLDEKEFRR